MNIYTSEAAGSGAAELAAVVSVGDGSVTIGVIFTSDTVVDGSVTVGVDRFSLDVRLGEVVSSVTGLDGVEFNSRSTTSINNMKGRISHVSYTTQSIGG